jgi:leucyl-tRNA synthetase
MKSVKKNIPAVAKNYDHQKIEPKWRKIWDKTSLNKTSDKTDKPKFFILDMFPYPSGQGLHVGHPRGYIATDVYSRYKKMHGFNVLHPMGWDAFGLPAENYAIKNKTNPVAQTVINVKRYKEQMEMIGLNYDWNREINTTDPAYYKWTQWIFVQLLKKGLAYESFAPINWCPSCKTGLANEDLENGKCERCGSVIEKKPMRQWVLKITDYADRLLKDIDDLNWPESIKESQRNWIGRSEGVNFKQEVKDLEIKFEVYDSIPQTFLAQTFTVIAPEHPMVKDLVRGTPQEKTVLDFVEMIVDKKRKNKFDVENDLEGIFTGRYVKNPFGTGDLPIWIASYVLVDYGTGIVNCSAHDERDFNFAKKYNIPFKTVLLPKDDDLAQKVKRNEVFYRQPDGILQSPEEFKGLTWSESRQKIIDYIVNKGLGERKVNYKLRDWVFSRQRYWGEPIPVVHCERCGVVPVPEKELPVVLPKVKFYEPTGTGESPLANIEKWVNTKCPKCKGKAKRETNTMPQWAGSSWYYLRYMDSKNSKALVDSKKEKYWAPVDLYVGGTEHATRHLIYARFWHKFLYDTGVVSTKEPFMRLKNQGMILGSDNRKMSKRWGNVVNPDDVVKNVGADTLRVYEMFMGPFEQEISWSTDNMVGSRRFLERVWKLQEKISDGNGPVENKEFEMILHRTIKKVTEDILGFNFNTVISALMILINAAEKVELSRDNYEIILKLLAPFAPHITEEIWANLGNKKSIHIQTWPDFDAKKIVSENVTVVVQINGKPRANFEVAVGTAQAEVEKIAYALPEVAKWMAGKQIKKVMFIKEKILSVITD